MKNPRRLIDRHLSWLSFNHRVLQEAADPQFPLLERLRFLAIFPSNLDEFFRRRVASIRPILDAQHKRLDTPNDPAALLEAIRREVDRQQGNSSAQPVTAPVLHKGTLCNTG